MSKPGKFHDVWVLRNVRRHNSQLLDRRTGEQYGLLYRNPSGWWAEDNAGRVVTGPHKYREDAGDALYQHSTGRHRAERELGWQERGRAQEGLGSMLRYLSEHRVAIPPRRRGQHGQLGLECTGGFTDEIAFLEESLDPSIRPLLPATVALLLEAKQVDMRCRQVAATAIPAARLYRLASEAAAELRAGRPAGRRAPRGQRGIAGQIIGGAITGYGMTWGQMIAEWHQQRREDRLRKQGKLQGGGLQGRKRRRLLGW